MSAAPMMNVDEITYGLSVAAHVTVLGVNLGLFDRLVGHYESSRVEGASKQRVRDDRDTAQQGRARSVVMTLENVLAKGRRRTSHVFNRHNHTLMQIRPCFKYVGLCTKRLK
jgi:hypothetical protein